MKRYLPSLTAALFMLGSGMSHAVEARLETSNIVAYRDSIIQLNVGLSQEDIADLNWQLTLLAYGEKPAAMGDEDFAMAIVLFMIEHSDTWLERLEPYDGFTAEQIMAVVP